MEMTETELARTSSVVLEPLLLSSDSAQTVVFGAASMEILEILPKL
jgi:hypothetical protein